MFSTRLQLKQKIEQLEAELRAEQEKTHMSAIIEKVGLPQCKGMYCYGCVYACYARSGNRQVLLGCGKRAECEDFTPGNAGPKLEIFPR